MIYSLLDGICLGLRGSSRNKEAVPVAHGITHEGKRIVLHLGFGGQGKHGVMERSAEYLGEA